MNIIHDTAVIGVNVELGEGNEILPYTVISGPISIGDNNIIGPHVVLGSPGQDTRNPRYDSSHARIRIGSNNIIREFTAVQKPCYEEVTELGNGVFLMQGVHIPHDALVEDGVVITPTCVLAGMVKILRFATLGLGVKIHQHCVVGQYSMVAMGACLTRNVRPFTIHVPGKESSLNLYALEKFGLMEFTDELERYVRENKPVKSVVVGEVIDRFELISSKSGRKVYS